MVRHRRRTGLDYCGEIPDAELATCQGADNLQPRCVGEQLERVGKEGQLFLATEGGPSGLYRVVVDQVRPAGRGEALVTGSSGPRRPRNG